MFNRFSAAARTAVTAAVEQAQRRGDRHVGTEHLLLGLLTTAPTSFTEAFGADATAAQSALDAMDLEALSAVGITGPVAVGEAPRGVGQVPFSAGAKDVLRRTLAEAVRRHDRRLEPVHVALALLDCRHPDPVAGLLDRLGIDPSVTRSRLDRAA